jgi:hypothetical protein
VGARCGETVGTAEPGEPVEQPMQGRDLAAPRRLRRIRAAKELDEPRRVRRAAGDELARDRDERQPHRLAVLGALGSGRLVSAASEVCGETRAGGGNADPVEQDRGVGRPGGQGDRMDMPVHPERQAIDDVLGAHSPGTARPVVPGVDAAGPPLPVIGSDA